MTNSIAIIPAAGSSNRMGFDKITSKLDGIPLLARTIQTLSASENISGIIIATSTQKIQYIKTEIIEKYNLTKVINIVAGGETRSESVRHALQAIESPPEVVAIHDGARPFVSVKVIDESIVVAKKFGGAIVANKVIPTIKEVDPEKIIRATIDRSKLWAAATPQSFRYDEFIAAYKKYLSENKSARNITDDAQIFELAGKKVKIVEGNPENIKLTTPFDWKLAEMILKTR